MQSPETPLAAAPTRQAPSLESQALEAMPLADQKPLVEKPVVVGAHNNAALRVGDGQNPPRRSLVGVFSPNKTLSRGAMRILVIVEALLALAFWFASPIKVLPKPDEVLAALQRLWMTQGLGQELAASLGLNFTALAWSSLISLGLAYSTVLPFMRPIVAAISRGRFLSMVGFSLIFVVIWGGGRPVQNAMLIFGITVFYVTSMASVIAAIPKGEFDHARTLRMSEWRVVWEVVVLGTLEKAFEVLRQNAAIGWMMLTLVEGAMRDAGGLGVALLNQRKAADFAAVFAIQLLILIIGLLQDGAISLIRRVVCPFADLTLERR